MKVLKSEWGFSLMEVSVGAGILAAGIMAVMTTIQVAESRTKSMRQSLEMLELKQTLLKTMGDVSKCSAQAFVGMQIDVTGATATTPAPQGVLDIPSLYDGLSAAAPLLAVKNSPMPGTQTGIQIEKIQLQDVLMSKPGTEYRAKLSVYFRFQSTGIAVRPVEASVVILTRGTDPDNAKTIISCASDSVQGNSNLTLASFKCPNSDEAVVGFDPAGFPLCSALAGGGGGGPSPSPSPTPSPSTPSTTWKLYQTFCSGANNTSGPVAPLYTPCSTPGDYWTYCRPPITGECVGVPGATHMCAVAICQ